MVINTTLGLIQYEKHLFGVASAPKIFQKIIEVVVTAKPGCAMYFDAVIIIRKTYE